MYFLFRSALQITRKSPLSFFICCIMCSSCYTARFYTPNKNPTPLFRKKGDFYFDASTNMFNKINGTIGYAIINGIGAYGGAGYSSEKTSGLIWDLGPEYIVKSEGWMQNYGIGYFLDEKRSKRFRFELFADVTLGDYKIARHHRYTLSSPVNTTAYLTGQYQKTGFVCNIGRSARKFFNYGYTLRCSRLEFYNPSFIERAKLDEETGRLYSKRYYDLIEHGLYGRLGNNGIAFQVQCALYHSLYTNNKSNAVQQFNASLMLSLVVNPNLINAWGKQD